MDSHVLATEKKHYIYSPWTGRVMEDLQCLQQSIVVMLEENPNFSIDTFAKLLADSHSKLRGYPVVQIQRAFVKHTVE